MIRYQLRRRTAEGQLDKLLCQTVMIERIRENPTYKNYSGLDYYIAKIKMVDHKVELIKELPLHAKKMSAVKI